jgi:hypothetical protein
MVAQLQHIRRIKLLVQIRKTELTTFTGKGGSTGNVYKLYPVRGVKGKDKKN